MCLRFVRNQEDILFACRLTQTRKHTHALTRTYARTHSRTCIHEKFQFAWPIHTALTIRFTRSRAGFCRRPPRARTQPKRRHTHTHNKPTSAGTHARTHLRRRRRRREHRRARGLIAFGARVRKHAHKRQMTTTPQRELRALSVQNKEAIGVTVNYTCCTRIMYICSVYIIISACANESRGG